MAGLTPLDGSRRDAALPANPSLCLRTFAPVRGAAGLRGVPLVMPLTHSQSATGGIHLVLLCVYWLTVLRGWGRDKHYLPDTQLRALPTQSLINSVQLSSWPLSAHPALSPCRALGTMAGGPCLHGPRAGHPQSGTCGFPSRTPRKGDTFLLLVQSLLPPEPKGAGSLTLFPNSWF